MHLLNKVQNTLKLTIKIIIRNILPEYNFRCEFLIVFWILFIHMNIIYALIAIVGESFAMTLVTNNIKNLLLANVSFIYPLLKKNKYNLPLTPPRVFQGFTFFIMDETCIDIFNKYLFYLSKIEQAYKSRK